MAFLKPDKIRTEHGLVIKEKIIPWGAVWTKNYGSYKKGSKFKADRKLSNGTGKVQYITIHNTDDIAEAKGTNDAEQYTRATYPNQNMGDARVHYFIDETDCWQNLREDEVGWHAGDGRGNGNETSIGIEIIMSGNGSKADTDAEDRGALLAAILLNRHGLKIDRMVPHKHWSGKNCPIYILPHWELFVAKVEAHLAKIQGKVTATANGVNKGDTVSISSNAVYYNGKDVPDWVVATKWIVKSVSGDRIVIDKSVDGKYSINSPINVKYLTSDKKQFEPYTVKLVTPIHKSASADSPVVGTIDSGGIYTIVEENGGWGKLKSGAGWISLDYVVKI
jgi:N-acetylmuramoyl-L-alanine amidase CwlA